MKYSTLLHLRIPFSFFLMPVFLFAMAVAPQWEWWRMPLVFVVLHVFLYPASNAYNSYYDKDEGSIGGLENPPPVDEELWRVALLFDVLALLLGLCCGWRFSLALLVYGLVSKAYSHDKIRLKKYPIIGWLTVGLFQGMFSFLMTYQALTNCNISELLQAPIITPAILCTVMLLGSYPMTQVYQHDEDRKRGDRTISLLLGIKGTFVYTSVIFALSAAAYCWYFSQFSANGTWAIAAFGLTLLPTGLFFGHWFWRVWHNTQAADFRSTMWLNLISSGGMNAFFLFLTWLNHFAA